MRKMRYSQIHAKRGTLGVEGVKIDVNISELVRLKTRAISKWQAAMESAGGLYTFNNNVSPNIR
jgi:hypothetical protein